MAKQTSLTKSLEVTQRNAVRELAKTRKLIREQKEVSPYEYAILHEETVLEAKKAAELIDTITSQLSLWPVTTLILLRERADAEQYMLAVADTASFRLLPDGGWKLGTRSSLAWNDARLFTLQSINVKGEETLTFKTPLHHLLGETGAFIAFSDEEVAKHLLPSKKKGDGDGTPPDRFNFLYSLVKKLGHEFHNEPMQKRVIKERERVTSDCRQHLKSLAGVLDEFFVRGAHPPYHNFKGDASPILLSRAKGLAESMRDSLHECKLYGVDTEESREIAAFGKRWINYFGAFSTPEQDT